MPASPITAPVASVNVGGFEWLSQITASSAPLVSPATRFDASVPNTTTVPSRFTDGRSLEPFPGTPAAFETSDVTGTSTLIDVEYTSVWPFVSSGASEAVDW